jgi:hypothetical protein
MAEAVRKGASIVTVMEQGGYEQMLNKDKK